MDNQAAHDLGMKECLGVDGGRDSREEGGKGELPALQPGITTFLPLSVAESSSRVEYRLYTLQPHVICPISDSCQSPHAVADFQAVPAP